MRPDGLFASQQILEVEHTGLSAYRQEALTTVQPWRSRNRHGRGATGWTSFATNVDRISFDICQSSQGMVKSPLKTNLEEAKIPRVEGKFLIFRVQASVFRSVSLRILSPQKIEDGAKLSKSQTYPGLDRQNVGFCRDIQTDLLG